jgi:hypothetical protein
MSAIKLGSPGVFINEVDLTRGTSDAISTNIAAMVGPFEKGPVNEMILIETEAELQRTFGNPTRENYEYWWTIANYLEYGGVCYVVRCDDEEGDVEEMFLGDSAFGLQYMRNASDINQQMYDGITGPYVKNDTEFFEDFYEEELGTASGGSPAHFIARSPGSWGNALGVAVIDAGADYKLRLNMQNIRHYNKDLSAFENQVGPNNELPLYGGIEYDHTLLGGFQCADYYQIKATGNWEKFNEDTVWPVYVEVFDTPNADKQKIGGGYIMAPNDTTTEYIGVYRFMLTWGKVRNGTFVSLDGGATVSNGLQGSYRVGSQKLYKVEGQPVDLLGDATTEGISGTQGQNLKTDGSGRDQGNNNKQLEAEIEIADPNNPDRNPMVINTIWAPSTFTKAEGNDFGWPANPRMNQKVFPSLPGLVGPTEIGLSYVYNARTELWYNLSKPAQGDLVQDGEYVYEIQAIGDWYRTQVAFSGIYWDRFGPRPIDTTNAQDRGVTNDGLNIIVYDATGDLTGSRGNVLETFFGVSKLRGTYTLDNTNNYYADRINNDSIYVYSNQPLQPFKSNLNPETNLRPGDSIVSNKKVSYIAEGTRLLHGGRDNLKATLGERLQAYRKFDIESVEILDYILQGPSEDNADDATSLANNIISICESRKDCMCFLSPPRNAVINQLDAERSTARIVQWADSLTSSSYAVFDSGYKQMYDRYRDERNTYVPLNGDVAGCVVNTAFRAEPWFSPAGISRGQIRNVTKLPYSPSKSQRDNLYSARVNAIVTYKGEGTVLWGDKTALAYSSAFDRINVRRLFLVIEREIAKISRTTLFELNDEITRTLFKNNVNPYLRDVQARRGMYDFLVVCDETNNTPEVIDRNEFIADIYIKPARSINFITLNFIATKTGVSFDESIALFRRNSI